MRNASLETVSASNPDLPDCWNSAGYGTNTATQTRVTDAHSGTYASRIVMTSHTDGDAKLVPRFDLGDCSSQIAQGRTYQVSAWYKSDVPVFFTVYQRNAVGQWSYWTQSPRLAAQGGWTHATWITPVPPAAAVAASFGLTIDNVGTLPSRDALKKIRRRIAQELRTLRGAAPAEVIAIMNPIIRGQANYYRPGASKRAFQVLDQHLWQHLYSPDDPALARYWADRRRKRKPPQLAESWERALRTQHGLCPMCREPLLYVDDPPDSCTQWETWYKGIRKALAHQAITTHGSNRTTYRLLHAHCARRHPDDQPHGTDQ